MVSEQKRSLSLCLVGSTTPRYAPSEHYLISWYLALAASRQGGQLPGHASKVFGFVPNTGERVSRPDEEVHVVASLIMLRW